MQCVSHYFSQFWPQKAPETLFILVCGYKCAALAKHQPLLELDRLLFRSSTDMRCWSYWGQSHHHQRFPSNHATIRKECGSYFDRRFRINSTISSAPSTRMGTATSRSTWSLWQWRWCVWEGNSRRSNVIPETWYGDLGARSSQKVAGSAYLAWQMSRSKRFDTIFVEEKHFRITLKIPTLWTIFCNVYGWAFLFSHQVFVGFEWKMAG